MSRSPPLRFLILLLGGWAGIRAALLAPAWWTLPAEAGDRPAGQADSERPAEAAPAGPGPAASRRRAAAGSIAQAARAPGPGAVAAEGRTRSAAADRPPVTILAWTLAPAAATGRRPSRPAGATADPVPEPAAGRWSFAAWSFLRGGDAAPLAAGGMLGGSQAGARLSYRLNRDRFRPLALSARLTAPVRRPTGAEAAIGIDWRPSRRLPLHLLAERRQKLGPEGRSAFGLTLYAGVADAPLGGLRVDAYAQAGIVGTQTPDPFGDGALRLSLPVGRRMRLGAGAWAAAQPGLARLDLGPHALLRLELGGRNLSVAADWRHRVAGNARPGSGPALTLATDF